jgi:hypothetical protein
MHLSKHAIEKLAQMICGAHGNPDHPRAFEWSNFPYRTGYKLYDFFREDCRLNPIPDFAGTRITWAIDVLTEINEGKVNHWGISSDRIIFHVIRKLLESVAQNSELDQLGAIENVNEALAEDGVRVALVDGKYVFTRVSDAGVSLGLVGYSDIEKCLDDFALHVKSRVRMSFWQKKSGKYEWIPRPERYAQNLLHTSLSMRFGESVFTFEEVGAGAGRIDIYVVTPMGEKVIVELKMCGRRYSESYAQGGIDQLLHYMENRNTSIGYLMVFDSRSQNFSQGFQDNPMVINGMSIITKIVDVRPQFR